MLEERRQPFVIIYKGMPVYDIKTAFKGALKAAGIKRKLSTHCLKHTAITWMMQANVPLSHISERTNTSEKILLKVYGHHRPDAADELNSIFST
ncbi:MAG: tyrosine-type recombinase/integrase [Octadecabacter sp.]